MRRREDGFTVLEVMIGVGLFALIMPVMISSVVSVSRLNDRAADLTRANVLAEKKAESLRSAGYNSLVVDTTPVTFTGELDASFTAPRSATYVVSQPELGVKEILIDIQYTDSGNNRQLLYKTLMSELGVAQ